MERRPITDGERIAARIEQRGECWAWIGQLDRDGYPVFRSSTRTYWIVPTLWVQENGPVPDGHALTCTHQRHRDQPCVNPAHYRPARNLAYPARCAWGHDQTDPMNVAWSQGRRLCLPCIQQRSLASRQERRNKTPKRERT